MEPTRYSDLRTAGWSRHRIAQTTRTGQWRRVVRGTFAPGPEPDLLADLRALFLVLPPTAMLGFHTAARLHGFGVLRERAPHVVVPAGTPVPDFRGIKSHQAVLPIGDPVWVAGLPCVPPQRCAIDLARTTRRLDAIAVLDAAMRSGHCTRESLEGEIGRHGGLRGVRQGRELVGLADPRAECRQESQLRLVLIDGRLARPEPQIWVYDGRGTPRYRLDLGYEALQVAAEYDGASHLDRQRLRGDRQRHNWLSARGWILRYFTDADLYYRQPYIVTTMREAIARASS